MNAIEIELIQKHAYAATGKLLTTIGKEFPANEGYYQQSSLKVYAEFLQTNGPVVLIKEPIDFNYRLLAYGLAIVMGQKMTDKKLSKTLFKDWDTIRNTPGFVLDVAQFISYLKTFTGSDFGIKIGYDGKIIYGDDKVSEYMSYANTFTETISYEEYYNMLLDLASSNTGLSSDDVKVCIELLNVDDIDKVANREIKLGMYVKYNTVPKDPEEFIKYVIYKATDETLVVKNDALYESLKASEISYWVLFELYTKTIGNDKKALTNLAKIYYRYKKVFAVIKNSDYNVTLSKMINKISKLAKKYHEPIVEPWYMNVLDNLDAVTQESLEALDSDRLGKLAYILGYEYRIIMDTYITKVDNQSSANITPKETLNIPYLYQIRNGKSWVKNKHLTAKYNDIVDYLNQISNKFAILKTVLNNRIHMDSLTVDDNSPINYALPTTGKQFTGNIPHGSYINLPGQDLIFGIHWENYNGKRVDLDLSFTNNTGKIGWDSDRARRGQMFSGDVTQSENSATELLYLENVNEQWWSLNVNFFNREEFDTKTSKDYEFTFFIASPKDPYKNVKNQMVKPDEIIYQTNITFEDITRELSLGNIVDNMFVFDKISLSVDNTSDIVPDDLARLIKNRVISKYMLGKLDVNTTKSQLLNVLK